jgi:hypothetical protein
MVDLKFLGNLGTTDDGRRAYARIGDEHPYHPGDRLVQVWQMAVNPEPDDTPESLAEVMWVAMNADDRPTGKFFRSMCVGDVVMVDDVALVCCAAGFERLDTVPPYESGLGKADLLAALRAS